MPVSRVLVIDPARKAKLNVGVEYTYCSINVADLISIGVEKGTSELNLARYSVVTADNSYRGEIKVAITFTAAKVHKLAHGFVQFV
jgi:hypothetical protein